MASIEELIEMAKNAQDAPLPGDYHDQLQTAVLQSWEPRDEKIKRLEEEKAASDAKVREYAVANFDLVRKGQTEPPKDEPKPPERMTTQTLVQKMMEK